MKFKKINLTIFLVLIVATYLFMTTLQMEYNMYLVKNTLSFEKNNEGSTDFGLESKNTVNNIASITEFISDYALNNDILVMVNTAYERTDIRMIYLAGNNDKITTYLYNAAFVSGSNDNFQSPDFSLYLNKKTEFGQLYFIGKQEIITRDIEIRSINKLLYDEGFTYTVYGSFEERNIFLNQLTDFISDSTLAGNIQLNTLEANASDSSFGTFNRTHSLQLFVTIVAFLLFALVFYEHFRKSKRYISVLSQHGYSSSRISFSLFAKILVQSVVTFLISLLFFNLINTVHINRVTVPFIKMQLIAIFFFLCAMILVAILSMLYIKFSNRVNQLKAKNTITNSFYMLALIQAIFFMNVMPTFIINSNSFINEIRNYQIVLQHKDELLHVSAITGIFSGGNTESRAFDTRTVFEELLNREGFYQVSTTTLGDFMNSYGTNFAYIVNRQYAQDFFSDELNQLINKYDKKVILYKGKSLTLDEKQQLGCYDNFCEAVRVSKLPSMVDYNLFATSERLFVDFKAVTVLKDNESYSSSIFTFEKDAGSTDYFKSVLKELGVEDKVKVASTYDALKLYEAGLFPTLMRTLSVSLIYGLAMVLLLILNFKLYIATRQQVLLNYLNHGYSFISMMLDYIVVNAILYSCLLVYFYLRAGFNAKVLMYTLSFGIIQLIIARAFAVKEIRSYKEESV